MKPRIAIFMYGITRGFEITHLSLEENFLSFLERDYNVDIFGAFYRQASVVNERSGELSALDYNNYQLINFEEVKLLDPSELDQSLFEELKSYGDSWGDSHKSIENITKQLFSLKTCLLQCDFGSYDMFFFLRPDLYYHDSVAPILDVLARRKDLVLLPSWQNWGGFNDRFLMTNSAKYAQILGTRYDRMLDYCMSTGLPFHSEKFLRWNIDRNKLSIKFISLKASRVRADGKQKIEDFDTQSSLLDEFYYLRKLKSALRRRLRINNSF